MNVSAPPPRCGSTLSTAAVTARRVVAAAPAAGRGSAPADRLTWRRVTDRTRRRPRALVVSASPIGEAMAGPAIRAFEMARALRPVADVTLAAAHDDPSNPPGPDVDHLVFRQRDPSPLRDAALAADVIVAQPPWPQLAAWARRSGARLVYDLYDPEPLEVLAHIDAGGTAGSAHADGLMTGVWRTFTLDRVLDALHDAHHLLCASEKQRDLWIGAMLAERLIDARNYARDPSFRDVIDVVPFGLPDEPPRHTGGTGVRGHFPSIAADDEIVLWNGGLWNWLDAPTAILAMGELAERRPVRLVFMGHTENVNSRRAAAQARAVAEREGLLDRAVFFNDGWVPYAERGDWLLEADCAVSCHVEHLETRYAFRTRLLDCFWAGLPIVCTRGDELATRVERDGLGAAVEQARPAELADALEGVLERGRAAYADALASTAAAFAWERVTQPVVRFATAGSLPPRIGHSSAARTSRSARAAAFRGARAALARVGLSDWPRTG